MVVCSCVMTNAAIIVEVQNEEDTAFAGWAIGPRFTGDSTDGALDTIPATVDGETSVRVTSDTAGVFTPSEGVVYTTGSNLAGDLDFTENGLAIASVSFDFYAGADGTTGAPDALSLYFQTDGAVWFYQVDNIVDGWGNYTVGITSESGWVGWDSAAVGATQLSGTFLTDLASVDHLGFSIAYVADLDGQQYAFDDVALQIPEPETYLVLGMALLSVAVVFRKRISDSLAEARSMMHA